MSKTIFLLALGVVLLALLALLGFIVDDEIQNSYRVPGQIVTESNWQGTVKYRYFEANGMPCIYVVEGSGNSQTGGPTCDWSKWAGK